jgi:hypothetical protein
MPRDIAAVMATPLVDVEMSEYLLQLGILRLQ